jgi:hypothetical protein
MDSVAIRVFSFSILPVIIAAGHLGLDRSSRPRERRLEIFLLYLFGVGVAGSGIGGFFGHVFLSNQVAESIGWPTGNPFQLEVGVANLALGILGIVAMGRRDGFREATVTTATVLGVGATVVPWHGRHRDRQPRSRQHHPEHQQSSQASLADRVPGGQQTSGAIACFRSANPGIRSMARTKDPRRRVDDRNRRRRVRRRLRHRPAPHRYAGWDPGWRRPGRLRPRSCI